MNTKNDYNRTGTFIGVSGIGKTTLLTAMYREMKEKLKDIPGVTCKPTGDSAQILRENYQQIESIFEQDVFQAEVLQGTSEPTWFNIEINANGKSINVGILDYPGGMLGNENKDEEIKIKNWINESSFVIVPIDAALIMEAENAIQSAKAKKIHQLEFVRELLLEWCGKRQGNGLLIFAPLKCETYFNDNPKIKNREDRSKELKRKINKFFSELNEKTYKYKNLEIKYIPVDTLGSVLVKNVDWNDTRCSFMMDREAGGRYMPLGGLELLSAILNFNLNEEKGSFWKWFFGINKKLDKAIEKLKKIEIQRLVDWS